MVQITSVNTDSSVGLFYWLQPNGSNVFRFNNRSASLWIPGRPIINPAGNFTEDAAWRSGGKVIVPIYGAFVNAYSVDISLEMPSDLISPALSGLVESHAFEGAVFDAMVSWSSIGDTIQVSIATDNTPGNPSLTLYGEPVVHLAFDLDSSVVDTVLEVPVHWHGSPETSVNERWTNVSDQNLLIDATAYGDISSDGSVSSGDASLILQYVVDLIPTINERRADVSANGTVSGLDASWVLRRVSTDHRFPVEDPEIWPFWTTSPGDAGPDIANGKPAAPRTAMWLADRDGWSFLVGSAAGIASGVMNLALPTDSPVMVSGEGLIAFNQQGSRLQVAFARLNDGGTELVKLIPQVGWTTAPIIETSQLNEGAIAMNVISLPTTLTLSQNNPNPFNPATTIGFALPQNEQVRLVIYSVAGQEVRTLIDSEMPAGFHRAVWNALDEAGRPVASGLYFYQITAGRTTVTKRMLLIR
jgi:hypothetical protein